MPSSCHGSWRSSQKVPTPAASIAANPTSSRRTSLLSGAVGGVAGAHSVIAAITANSAAIARNIPGHPSHWSATISASPPETSIASR